jgi:hypothetical protein
MRRGRQIAWVAVLWIVCGGAAAAQPLPSEPIALAGGVVTLGGNVSGTVGPEDKGFFNYTDYEDSLLRMLRIDVTAAVRGGGHFAVLGEVRSQNAARPEAYALYLRVRPWTTRRFDIQVGRIPPVFGAFSRRSYEADNPLIGYPLAYQYLTSLRPDAVPATADELLQMRGRGWLANYSLGNPTPAPGVPLVSALRWDTGVQVSAANDVVEAAGAITVGTLSHPLFTDDNDGKQIAGRVALHPSPSVIVGLSGAHGPFVSSDAAHAVTGSGRTADYAQTAWGADLEFSRDYYVVRAETVVSSWRLPVGPSGAPGLDHPLRAIGTAVEGRYKLRPGLYLAARGDHLTFSTITGSQRTASWDAIVTRVEVGGGYYVRRNVLLKVTAQFNTRNGGRTRDAKLLAGQAVYWF